MADQKVSYSVLQKQRREAAYNAVQSLIARTGAVPTEEEKTAIEALKGLPRGRALQKDMLFQIFGDTVSEGMSVSALDIFQRFGKGGCEMKSLCRKWSKQLNVLVVFDADKSIYTVITGSAQYNGNT